MLARPGLPWFWLYPRQHAAMMKNWQAVFSRVKAALMRRGRSADEADDLVHEAWIRLAFYERERRVEEPEAFLMRAALNLSTDVYRAERRRGEQVLVDADELPDDAPSIEATVLARERVSHLSKCVRQLNSKTRDIFIAHRIDGMSYQQIAKVHRMSVSAVEKHVAKATLLVTSWMEGW